MKGKEKWFMILVLALLVGIGRKNAVGQEKISMVYLYGNYDYETLLKRNVEAVNTVSPSYFDLDNSGNLVVGEVDENLVRFSHQNHVKVTPFLSNHWDREKGRMALQNRKTLVNEIVLAINQYHLDGICVDLENLTSKEREAYIDLAAQLRAKMPSDKTLSVAVSANPYYINSGWQASYDYQSLAQNSDYLVVMAYDEHYEGGEMGAVASINFVKQSIEYALSQVDKNKVVLSLPFYGRYWKEGEDTGGYGITLKQVQKLLENYESSTCYDVKTEQMKATIYIHSSDNKTRINGRVLEEGCYQIFYENSESMAQKIKLAQEYQLRGISDWSLGQETDVVWNEFGNYLLNIEEKKQSKQESEWSEEAIMYVKEKGWMIGKTKTSFAPQDALSRAELTVILTRVLKIDTRGTINHPFMDTWGHWAEKEIALLAKMGMIEGYEDGLFYPDKAISRAEVAKILSLLIVENKQKDVLLLDVNQDDWAYPYIQKMAKNGVMVGYPDDTYKPQQNISRAEIAMVLRRMNFKDK